MKKDFMTKEAIKRGLMFHGTTKDGKVVRIYADGTSDGDIEFTFIVNFYRAWIDTILAKIMDHTSFFKEPNL